MGDYDGIGKALQYAVIAAVVGAVGTIGASSYIIYDHFKNRNKPRVEIRDFNFDKVDDYKITKKDGLAVFLVSRRDGAFNLGTNVVSDKTEFIRAGNETYSIDKKENLIRVKD